MNAQILWTGLLIGAIVVSAVGQEEQKRFLGTFNMDVPHVSSDDSVKLDFPIVYVRAPRRSPDGRSRWTEVGRPRTMETGADLVILNPDGREDVLVAV